MTFDIYRTSDYWGHSKPCDGAVLDSSRKRGIGNYWTIEINSLEELLDLRRKVEDGCLGELVLTDQIPCKIEILDGNRKDYLD